MVLKFIVFSVDGKDYREGFERITVGQECSDVHYINIIAINSNWRGTSMFKIVTLKKKKRTRFSYFFRRIFNQAGWTNADGSPVSTFLTKFKFLLTGPCVTFSSRLVPSEFSEDWRVPTLRSTGRTYLLIKSILYTYRILQELYPSGDAPKGESQFVRLIIWCVDKRLYFYLWTILL
jgi:hypothetical protein